MAAGALAVAGCNPYGCTYETRFVGTTGTTTATAGKLAVEYVNMREYRDGGPVPNALIWSAKAESLVSPAKTLTLRNAANEVVATLSMSSSSGVSMTANGSFDTQPGDARFSLLLSGTARVVLELEDGQTIVTTLAVSESEGWHHGNCS